MYRRVVNILLKLEKVEQGSLTTGQSVLILASSVAFLVAAYVSPLV